MVCNRFWVDNFALRMKRLVKAVVRGVATERNFFKAAMLAQLRKHLETNDEYTCKENSIAVYQRVYE